MNRRELLLGSAAVAVSALTTRALAADAMPEHEHHHETSAEGMHEHHHSGPANPKLLESAADCVKTGQLCIRHCFDLFAQGENKELAACAIGVNELIAVSSALQVLATSNSKHLAKYAKVSLDVCKACEEECRKHEKKHQTCKDCAEACAACAKECEKIV
jgi:Cys-rich four helix bundle protein (predicted Tat secretion target)